MFANLKKLILAVGAVIVLCGAAPANAKLATVGALHDYVRARWGIDVPRHHSASSLLTMRYLMQLVDAANLVLNGVAISDYANDTKYVSSAIVADTVATQAVDELIRKIVEYKFFFTPAVTENEYLFYIAAAGTFYVDWGDGKIEIVTRTSVRNYAVGHTYDTPANNYNIKLGGKATAYGTDATAAISFNGNASRLSAFDGCLGCIFSTIEDETVAESARQPRFRATFANNSALTGQIPEKLFDNVHGAPVSYMFSQTFSGCAGLTGKIPSGLFGGIKGAPAVRMYSQAFTRCAGLSGEIPDRLFGVFDGAPAEYMFFDTFLGCSNLSGPIPENLFAGIKGEGQTGMFQSTFYGCSKLTSIPQNIFAGIDPNGTYKSSMFMWTFRGIGVTGGYSPKIGDKYLYEIWPTVVGTGAAYSGCSALYDYQCIPVAWGGAGKKNPGECEPVATTVGE